VSSDIPVDITDLSINVSHSNMANTEITHHMNVEQGSKPANTSTLTMMSSATNAVHLPMENDHVELLAPSIVALSTSQIKAIHGKVLRNEDISMPDISVQMMA
jgi:hypothetical protein